jgi:hypothetical protein
LSTQIEGEHVKQPKQADLNLIANRLEREGGETARKCRSREGESERGARESERKTHVEGKSEY